MRRHWVILSRVTIHHLPRQSDRHGTVLCYSLSEFIGFIQKQLVGLYRIGEAASF